MARKPHWTQRPGGREKMAAAQKKGWKKRHAAKPAATPKPETKKADVTPIHHTPIFAYALGHVEAWIETYAKGAGVPVELLAAELGKVLQRKASR